MLKQTLPLDGAWKFLGLPADPTQRDHPHFPSWPPDPWLEGQVPGTVQADLLRLGRIPDPFMDTNALELGWIEDQDWLYQRQFTVPADFLVDKVVLRCEGLDTFATIWINRALVGQHANQFIPVEFDVKPYLKTGENEILILFRSTALELANRDMTNLWGDHVERVNARKCQCSFGWDWSPRIVTFGVWRSINLVSYRSASLRDLVVRTHLTGTDSAEIQVGGELERFGKRSVQVQLEVASLPAGEIVARGPATLNADRTQFSATFKLDRPALWWPNGMGEQPLYSCTARLSAGKDTLDVQTTSFGIREVGLRQEPIATGKSFILTVNGEPVFCKGANWGPIEALTVCATPEKYRAALELARDCNFTMLRVWGGGIFENPAFYDVCDELGILLWHDFMYACGGYPDYDESFRREAEHEARVAIRQLRNHPSIALWCGNNENQWIQAQRIARKEAPQPELAGQILYDEVLPRVCAELDPTRPYWPSSPWGGENPNAMVEGDRHAYNVALGISDDGFHDFSWKAMDYHNYLEDTGKFISEFAAFPAIPEPEALRRFISPQAMNTTSAAWRFHIPNIITWPAHFQDLLDFYVTNTFGIPRDNAIGLEKWMKYARLVQGEALSFGVEHFRRSKFQCSGTLFWFYTSIWPSSDWAIVDYYTNPKAGFYFTRRAYAPVLVSFRPMPDGGYEVWGVNDLRHEVKTTLQLQHGDFEGAIRWHTAEPVTIPANASVCLKAVARSDMRIEDARREYVAAVLKADGTTLSRNFLFLTDLRTVRFPPTRLSAHVQARNGSTVRIAVTTEAFARTVRLGLYGARCDDNYFHMLPGETREVTIDLSDAEGRTLTLSALNIVEELALNLAGGT